MCSAKVLACFQENIKISFTHPVLFGLMGIDQSRRVVQACCGGRASLFSCWDPTPMGLGRGLTEVTRSGQDRTLGIWAQDCGSRAPFVPSFMFFPACLFFMALNLERGEKLGSKPGLHNRDHSKEDSSLYRTILKGTYLLSQAKI